MARYEIELEKYAKTIHIEALTMAEMVRRQVIPAIMLHAGDLAAAAESIRGIGVQAEAYQEDVALMSDTLRDMRAACRALEAQVEQAMALDDPYEKRARSTNASCRPWIRCADCAIRWNRTRTRRPGRFPSYFDLMFRM